MKGESDVFVIPHADMKKTTSLSLDHSELKRYKNAWNLLTCSSRATASTPIEWGKLAAIGTPPALKLRSKKSIVLQKAFSKAESHGLTVKAGPGAGYKGQNFLYVSGRPCQVMQGTIRVKNNGFAFLYMNSPTSNWAEFVIFYSTCTDAPVAERFYVVPRAALPRNTARSLKSKWLREFDEAWHLLR
jgi:hypothetical protein